MKQKQVQDKGIRADIRFFEELREIKAAHTALIRR